MVIVAGQTHLGGQPVHDTLIEVEIPAVVKDTVLCKWIAIADNTKLL